MNKKPPELHIIDGTKPRGESTKNTVEIPEQLRKRIPQAEWLENFDAWDKKRFIEETANFLYEVYGIGNEQDKHTLSMLADHIDTYIQCNKGIKEQGIVVEFNDGKTIGTNPYLAVRNKIMTLIIQLMNELGLTPRGRLSINKPEEDSPVAKFLRGPKG